jgi:two-component system response regulator DesR
VRQNSPTPSAFPIRSGRYGALAGGRADPDAMEARNPVRLVLAEFEDLVSHGLRALVAEDSNIEVVSESVPYDQLHGVVARELPQVAIVNFGSLGSPNDVREMHAAHPDTRLVILANRPTPSECNQMLAFGATACLSKETQARDILSAIHLASRGLHVLPKTPREFGMTRMPGPELLTPREADVLEQLQLSRSNAEIAMTLHVGIETVRTHARNIYRKLGVRTRRDLATLSAPAPTPAAAGEPR